MGGVVAVGNVAYDLDPTVTRRERVAERLVPVDVLRQGGAPLGRDRISVVGAQALDERRLDRRAGRALAPLHDDETDPRRE